MQVVCPRCRNPVAGADIDLGARAAVCRPCGELFPLDAALAIVAAKHDVAVPRVYRPRDLGLVDVSDGTLRRYVHTRSRLAAIPLLGFAAMWDAFLVVWYANALSGGGGRGGIALWFPLIHVAVGVTITYRALGMLLNRTELVFDAGEFRCATRPLPNTRPLQARIPVSELESFRVRSVMSSGKRASVSWRIDALTRDERSIALPITLPSSEHAEFVVATLVAELDAARQSHTYRG